MEYQTAIMIIPTEPQRTQIGKRMRELNTKYHASKALGLPPHITVMSLGMVEESRLEQIEANINNLAKDFGPFYINPKGLEFTGSNEDFRGIYGHFEVSPYLYSLHENTVKMLKKFQDKDRGYKELRNWRPHMTLANDISDENLDIAKIELIEEKFPYIVHAKNLNMSTKNGGSDILAFEFRGKQHH